MDIGGRLKLLRTRKSLTLEELAGRCELTKGFLSQVERNLTSPSIATLNDILEALGTTLGEFFKEDETENIVFREEDYFVDEREDRKVTWIVPNCQKNKMEPVLIELEEGQRSFEVPPHDGEEFGYVLDGKVVLVNGEEQHMLKKGETFYLSGKNFHYIENSKKSTAKILWISMPPVF